MTIFRTPSPNCWARVSSPCPEGFCAGETVGPTALFFCAESTIGCPPVFLGRATEVFVTVTGTAGEPRAGVYPLTVEGLPEDLRVRVQTGPAINGTDLRDAPGDIAFGAFKNQIEYQDAGSGINRAMAAEVLAPIDTTALAGKQVTVTGAFRLINPSNWLITPVALEVQ